MTELFWRQRETSFRHGTWYRSITANMWPYSYVLILTYVYVYVYVYLYKCICMQKAYRFFCKHTHTNARPHTYLCIYADAICRTSWIPDESAPVTLQKLETSSKYLIKVHFLSIWLYMYMYIPCIRWSMQDLSLLMTWKLLI